MRCLQFVEKWSEIMEEKWIKAPSLDMNNTEKSPLTRARVAVSANFAVVGGQNDPPSNSKTRKARRPGDTAFEGS